MVTCHTHSYSRIASKQATKEKRNTTIKIESYDVKKEI